MHPRAEALQKGVARYFTGAPCKHGHVAERLTSNATCVECNRAHVLKWQVENADAASRKNKAWVAANPGRQARNRRRWHADNRAHVLRTMAAYRSAHLPFINSLSAKARADKLMRTPVWLTRSDISAMEALYRDAEARTAESGTAWHVDHVIPLRGKNVSGLHVPHNLQVIPAVDNLRKRNSFHG